MTPNGLVAKIYKKQRAQPNFETKCWIGQASAQPNLGFDLNYFVSRCKVCRRSEGQYFFSSMRAVSFFLFFSVV